MNNNNNNNNNNNFRYSDALFSQLERNSQNPLRLYRHLLRRAAAQINSHALELHRLHQAERALQIQRIEQDKKLQKLEKLLFELQRRVMYSVRGGISKSRSKSPVKYKSKSMAPTSDINSREKTSESSKHLLCIKQALNKGHCCQKNKRRRRGGGREKENYIKTNITGVEREIEEEEEATNIMKKSDLTSSSSSTTSTPTTVTSLSSSSSSVLYYSSSLTPTLNTEVAKKKKKNNNNNNEEDNDNVLPIPQHIPLKLKQKQDKSNNTIKSMEQAFSNVLLLLLEDDISQNSKMAFKPHTLTGKSYQLYETIITSIHRIREREVKLKNRIKELENLVRHHEAERLQACVSAEKEATSGILLTHSNNEKQLQEEEKAKPKQHYPITSPYYGNESEDEMIVLGTDNDCRHEPYFFKHDKVKHNVSNNNNNNNNMNISQHSTHSSNSIKTKLEKERTVSQLTTNINERFDLLTENDPNLEQFVDEKELQEYAEWKHSFLRDFLPSK